MKGIKEYTKEQLLQMAVPYLKKTHTMIATSDGNFFYSQDEHYADAHSRSQGFEKFILKKSDLNKPGEKVAIGKESDEDKVNDNKIIDKKIVKPNKTKKNK